MMEPLPHKLGVLPTDQTGKKHSPGCSSPGRRAGCATGSVIPPNSELAERTRRIDCEPSQGVSTEPLPMQSGHPPNSRFSAQPETLAGMCLDINRAGSFHPSGPNGPPGVPGIGCTVSPCVVMSLKTRVKQRWNSETAEKIFQQTCGRPDGRHVRAVSLSPLQPCASFPRKVLNHTDIGPGVARVPTVTTVTQEEFHGRV